MKTLCRYDKPKCSTRCSFQSARNRVPGDAIAGAHPPNVSSKYAVCHQVSDGTFHETRRKTVMGCTGGDNLFHRGWRKHEVGESQPGEQSLRECSDIDDAIGPIDTGERRQRRPAVAKLAVVII